MECKNEGCNNKVTAKGFCFACYQNNYNRIKRHTAKIKKAISLLENSGYSVSDVGFLNLESNIGFLNISSEDIEIVENKDIEIKDED